MFAPCCRVTLIWLLDVWQTMLEDKLKATDWEATNETISEQVARESYLQWLKDNEKRNKVTQRPGQPRCN